MKIFSTAQVRQWDAYTIANEPVRSVDLMERAASACFNWLINNLNNSSTYTVFCGTGNNGGDGLAIARMLLTTDHTVMVYILEGEKRSEDFINNLDRLKALTSNLQFIDCTNLPVIATHTVIIDALFGSGLSRPLRGTAAELVSHINKSGNTVISIDIPSGLFADESSEGNTAVQASHTLSFQMYKLAFLMAENSKSIGLLHLFNIGLHPQFYNDTPALFNTIDEKEIRLIYQPRNQFLHKYNFGHVLLYAGSRNMMGAAILCAKACLRSGAGLVTVFTEDDTQAVIQIAIPEAITTTDKDLETISKKKSAIGIGPGLELSTVNKELLQEIISAYNGPVVIDASALQLLSSNTAILKQRPSKYPIILTPHAGEFEKLFGKTSGDFERLKTARQKSVELECYIILKGHHTLIACPDGTAYFNTTGNAGMATAGSGDVLTGILSCLVSQGYSPKDALWLGVYLHGLAGDIAAKEMSQEAMIASDIIDNIGEAFKKIASFDKSKM
ncbi:MAG: NAD(P)H-hydrate dehydratase [Ferruginibacter sp.]